jgi:hypothetical protein
MTPITVNYRNGRGSLIGAICAAMQQNGFSAESIKKFSSDNREYSMRKLARICRDLNVEVIGQPGLRTRAAFALVAAIAAVFLLVLVLV